MNTRNIDPSRSILVLGANGRLGQAVAEAFGRAGWNVFAHSRRALNWRSADPHIQPVHGELDDAQFLRACGADVVVNAMNPIYTRWEREAVTLAATATRVARALNATLMFPGNIYNFSPSVLPGVDEHSAQNPVTRKGEIRVAIERAMAEQATEGPQTIVVRAGDFFGTGSGSWIDLVIAKNLRKGRIEYPGPLDIEHAWAYLPDLARVFVELAERRSSLGRFEVFPFGGHTLTGHEFVRALESAARSRGVITSDRQVVVSRTPWALLRTIGLVYPMLREVSKMRYLWTTPQRLIDTRLRELLGHARLESMTTPIETALSQTLGAAAQPASTSSVAPASDPAGAVV